MDPKEAFQRLAGVYKNEFVTLIECEVLSYDDSVPSIKVKPTSSVIQSEMEVRLSIAEGNNIECVPAAGSVVMVGINVNNLCVLVSVSDCDEINISANNKIVFNGGEFGGLAKIQKLTEQYNKLEDQVNDILYVLKNTTIPLAPSGTYPFASLYASINNLTLTEDSDIENPNITHGE